MHIVAEAAIETAAELMESNRKRETATAAAAAAHRSSRLAAALSRSSRIQSQSSRFNHRNGDAMGMEESWRDNIHRFGSSSSSNKVCGRQGKVRQQRGSLLKDNQGQAPRWKN